MNDIISEQDRKYLKTVRPSRGFSPARATAIIEQVIKEYDAELLKRESAFKDEAGERIDMASSYLMRREQGMNMSVEDYLGPRNLVAAWGERFAEKLKIASMLYRKTGKAEKMLL
jgi:hypothetical protein